MSEARYYPPSYRQKDVAQIVGALDQGASVVVIGAPSVGKSNLLRFLDQERLPGEDRQSPWSLHAPNALHKGPILTISLDPNALLPPLAGSRRNVAAAAWPGFELLIHRISITGQVYPRYDADAGQTASSDLVERIERLQNRFENAHLAVTDVNDPLHGHLALRHLENLIDAVLSSRRLQNSPARLVFVMDEFERMLGALPEYFFVALRSIRDRFKYQVMFVVFARNGFEYLVHDEQRMLALEPFIELFHDHTVYLGPFSDDDAWYMLQELEKRTVSRDDRALGLLMRAAGNFAGLLRAGFKHADVLKSIQAPDTVSAIGEAAALLAGQENVQAECRTMLRGLTPLEIAALYGTAAQNAAIDRAAAGELLHKSLLVQAGQGGVIRVAPPVLAAYVRANPTPPDSQPATHPVTLPR